MMNEHAYQIDQAVLWIRKLKLTLLLVDGLLGSAGGKAAQHLLILAHTDTLALDNLQVLETTQDVVVDLEDDLDVELGTLLDSEWLFLEGVDGTGGGQIDGDVGAAVDDERERLDDTIGVAGLANGLACVQTQGGLPTDHGLIVGICGEDGVRGVWLGSGGVDEGN